MKIVELSCPRCGAPIEATQTKALSCRFCGASLVVKGSDSGKPPEMRETFVVKLGRVGPSNRARVAKLIAEQAKLSDDAAAALVASGPCDIVTYDEHSSATRLARQVEEAGALAEVEKRIVAIAPPRTLPERDVVIEDAGSSKASVMKVLREHLDVDLGEAKRLVDDAPAVVVERLEGTRANALRDALLGAGARVVLKG